MTNFLVSQKRKGLLTLANLPERVQQISEKGRVSLRYLRRGYPFLHLTVQWKEVRHLGYGDSLSGKDWTWVIGPCINC